ncbi:MAG: SDR family oxidoreductase [Bradymonadia bacterium]
MTSIFREDLLKNETIIVTGGGSGIGAAIAKEVGSLGATVAIGARKSDRIEATATELRSMGIHVFAGQLDIRDETSIQNFLKGMNDDIGPATVLVNNAGGQFPSPALNIKPKGWRAVIDTNLNGTWLMTQAVAQSMFIKNGGKVINIVANMWRGFPGMAHTGAARAGVVNLTKSLALEWAKNGILVNAVAPGVIRSSGLETYPKAVRDSIETEVPKHIPLKRLGTMDDVAWAVTYLASEAGDYITGETICVDGGQAHWGTVFSV